MVFNAKELSQAYFTTSKTMPLGPLDNRLKVLAKPFSTQLLPTKYSYRLKVVHRKYAKSGSDCAAQFTEQQWTKGTFKGFIPILPQSVAYLEKKKGIKYQMLLEY